MTQPIQTGAVFNEQEAVQSINRLTGAINQLLAPINRLAGATDRVTPATRRFTGAQQQSTAAANAQTQAYTRTSASMHGMVRHTESAYAALNRMGSAAQGVMLGQALLQQSLMGVGFSLIFARFAMIRWMAAAAAATVVVGGAAGLAAGFISLQGAANSAARSMEDTGQRMASFFRSAETAQEILTQADEVARKFGVPRDEATKMLETLEKAEIRSNEYIKAILNAASATGNSISDVGQRFTDIMRAGAQERQGLIDQFVKDLNLPAKEYANTLELAEAMNERFAGSIEAFAQTQTGLIGRLTASWTSFLQTMGSITQEIVKPMLRLALSFTEGLIKGFSEAKEAGEQTGELKRTMDGLNESVEKTIPLLAALGNFLGQILYAATVKAAQGIKTFLDLFRSFANWLKQFRDILPSVQQAWKSFIDELFAVDFNEMLAGVISGLRSFFRGLPRAIARFASRAGGGITRALAPLGRLFARAFRRALDIDFRLLAQDLADDFRSIFSGIASVIRGSSRAITRAFRTIGSALIRGVNNIPFRAIGRSIIQFLDGTIARLSLTPRMIRGVVRSWDSLIITLRTMLDELVRTLRMNRTIRGTIRALGRDIATAFRAMARDLNLGPLFRAIRNRLISGMDRLRTIDFSTRLRVVGVSLRRGFVTMFDDVLPAIGRAIGPRLQRMLTRAFSARSMNFGSLARNIGRALRTVFIDGVRGAFRNIGRALGLSGDIVRGIRSAISGIFASPKRLLRGVFSGLKSGFIFGLIEALTIAAVDLLPVGENMKESLRGVLKTTFLGIAAGSFFGPYGALIGGGLAAAIGISLESVKPGLSEDFNQWLEDTLIEALGDLGSWMQDTVLPAIKDLAEWFGPRLKSAGQEYGDWLRQDAIPALQTTHKWFDQNLLPVLKSVGGWLRGPGLSALKTFFNWVWNDVIPALSTFTQWMGTNVWNAITSFSDWLSGDGKSSGEDFFGWLDTYVMPLLEEFNKWWEQIIQPTLEAFWGFLTGPFWTGTKNVFGYIRDTVLPIIADLWEEIDGPLWNDVLKPLAKWLKGEFESALIVTKDGFALVRGAINTLWHDVLVPFWNDILVPFADWWGENMNPMFETFHTEILKPLGTFIKDTLWPNFRDYIWHPLRDDVLPVVEDVIGAFNWMDQLASPFTTLRDAFRDIRDIWDKIAGFVQDVVDLIPDINWPDAPSWAEGMIPDSIPTPNFGGGGDDGGSFGGNTAPSGHPAMQHGGVVPGMPGTRKLVTAEAGEWFLGHPEYSSSKRLMDQMGGGGNSGTHIYLDLREAVVAGEQGVDALANVVSERIVRFLGNGRKITQHRV